MADNGQALVETSAAIRDRASQVAVTTHGLAPRSLAELMDFGQLMAKAGPMVGKAFRGEPGACIAVTMQAMRWNMDPFAVSQKAYVTGDTVAYEAQLVNAVVLSNAPMAQRPQYTFTGSGDTRRCKVAILLRGEPEWLEYETPEKVPVGNSPLWKKDLDQQLSYYAIRSWARRHMPELLMGVYTPDEMQDVEVIANEPVNSYAEDDSFIRGAEKDALVEDWNARLRASEDLDDIDNIMAEAAEKKSRLSRNTWDGLEHVAAEESERIKAGVAPKPPAPSPFEELKAQGLAVITIEDEADRLVAHGKWLSRVNAKSLTALCSASEREEIKTLKKTIKSELGQNSAGQDGSVRADGGASA